MANGVISLTLLRGQHAKIVPGFRIVWAQLDGLFEVLPRFWQGILAEVKSAKIVVGLWILRLGINDLLEGSGGLVKIAVLKHGNAVSEIIALEDVLVEGSGEGKGFPNSIGLRQVDETQVFREPFRIHSALVNLDDQSFFVKEERSGERQISATIEQIAVNCVVDAADFGRGEQSRKGQRFFLGECSRHL